MPVRITGLILVFIMLVAVPFAAAAETCPQVDEKYSLTLTPYVWLMDLKGTVGAKGYTLDVDAPFTKTSKHLNFAAMMAVDAMYKNRLGVTANLNLAMLGGQDSVHGVSLGSNSTMMMSDVAGVYRVLSRPLMWGGKGRVDIDLLAGMRIWRTGLKLDVETGSHRTAEYSQYETWADPMVGGRIIVGLTDRVNLRFRGGYGGFSTASKKTWDVSALMGYKVNERVRLVAGYRAVGVDYRKINRRDKFIFDVALRGPIVGAIFSF